MIQQVLKVLGSQLFLGLIGIVTLPITARGFGVESYGSFSLFVILLGVVYVFDLSRVIAVPKLSVRDNSLFESEFKSLLSFTALNSAVVAMVAGVLGYTLFDVSEALILALIGIIYTASGLQFAILSVNDKVGNANLIRNSVFALAYCLSALNAYLGGSVFLSMCCFLFANILIFVAYSYVVTEFINYRLRECVKFNKFFKELKKFEWQDVASLAIFNLSGSILTTTDKSLLKQNVSSSDFGAYSGHADLALKFNMISNAVGTALFPEFSKLVKANKTNLIESLFTKTLLLGGLGFFAAFYVLIHNSSQFITLVLGEEFLLYDQLFSYFLIGVFINFSSFLVVPMQRAFGDFKSSKNTYFVSASLVLLCAITLIPSVGIWAALFCYFIPRALDVVLLLITLANYFRQSRKVMLAVALFLIELGILIDKVL